MNEKDESNSWLRGNEKILPILKVLETLMSTVYISIVEDNED